MKTLVHVSNKRKAETLLMIGGHIHGVFELRNARCSAAGTHIHRVQTHQQTDGTHPVIGLGVEEGLVEQVVLWGRHGQHRDIGGDRANGVDEGLEDLGRERVIGAREDRSDRSNAVHARDGRLGSELLDQPIDVRIGQLGSSDDVLVEPQLGARAVPNGV